MMMRMRRIRAPKIVPSCHPGWRTQRTWKRKKASTRWPKTLYLWFKKLFLWLKRSICQTDDSKHTILWHLLWRLKKSYTHRKQEKKIQKDTYFTPLCPPPPPHSLSPLAPLAPHLTRRQVVEVAVDKKWSGDQASPQGHCNAAQTFAGMMVRRMRMTLVRGCPYIT